MSSLPPFHLEQYFALYEFQARFLLCCSDAESMKMGDLLKLAECIDLWNNLRLGYTETRGSPELCYELLKRYRNCAIENILCLPGLQIF